MGWLMHDAPVQVLLVSFLTCIIPFAFLAYARVCKGQEAHRHINLIRDRAGVASRAVSDVRLTERLAFRR